MKDELKRLKAGALAFMMAGSMTLSGCTSNIGFNYKTGEDNRAVAYDGSFINNECIDDCVVAEVYNELLNEKQLYIVKEYKNSDNILFYSDLLCPSSTLFYENNDMNNFLKLVKSTPLVDYINALGLSQMKYSYDDMVRIFDSIKNVYQYSNNLELTK